MGTPTQVCVYPNFSAPAGRPFRCVKSKVYDWYWKRKAVTQGDWVEMDVVLTYVKILTCKVFILNTKVHLAKLNLKSYKGMFLGYSQSSKAYIVLNKETMRIEESHNVTFNESFSEPKSSHSIEDDRINEPIVQNLNGSPSLQINVTDEGYPKSVKEARGHLIEQVIGELNERTLRSETKQA
ncbi:hypothetical protein Tco_0259774 [Tanacetum coccineum]